MNKKLIFLTIFLLMSRQVFAETLIGTVVDDGEPVDQATVALIDVQNNTLIKSTHTDSHGRFWLKVKKGSYQIRASKKEYADQWVKGIDVRGKDVSVDVTMTPQVSVDSTIVPEPDDCD